MNCVDMDCVHCKAEDIPCNIRINKDTTCKSIVNLFCELGHTVHVPFNDKGDRVYCDDYISRNKERGTVYYG